MMLSLPRQLTARPLIRPRLLFSLIPASSIFLRHFATPPIFLIFDAFIARLRHMFSLIIFVRFSFIRRSSAEGFSPPRRRRFAASGRFILRFSLSPLFSAGAAIASAAFSDTLCFRASAAAVFSSDCIDFLQFIFDFACAFSLVCSPDAIAAAPAPSASCFAMPTPCRSDTTCRSFSPATPRFRDFAVLLLSSRHAEFHAIYYLMPVAIFATLMILRHAARYAWSILLVSFRIEWSITTGFSPVFSLFASSGRSRRRRHAFSAIV